MASEKNVPGSDDCVSGDEGSLMMEMVQEEAPGRETTEAVVERILEKKMGRLEKIIQQQAALVFGKMAEQAETLKGREPVQKEEAASHQQVRRNQGESYATVVGREEASARAGGRLRQDLKAGSEILDPYDPDDPDYNVERWFHKLDQLAAIHGWTERDKVFLMQTKLAGGARKWFNWLQDFDLTWAEWKERLQRAFPRRYDFALSLEEMVNRKKLPAESMTHYFHAKLALCGRCKIEGEDAVSCIIRGLPEELRANAYAYRCATPDALYLQLLAGLEQYQQPSGSRRSGPEFRPAMAKVRRTAEATKAAAASSAEAEPRVIKLRCYNCQEYGTHLSGDCPKSRVERCRLCSQPGQERFNCLTKSRRVETSKAEASKKKPAAFRSSRR